jgi:hypothetical protein
VINIIEFGEMITHIGFKIIPVSFFAFILIRPLMLLWKRDFSKLIKSVWYLSLGASMLSGDYTVDTIVMLLAFIESYDLIFQYFDDKRIK